MLLQHLTEAAHRSYNWLSFNPEKRGDSVIREYSEELKADMDRFRAMGASEEQLTRYRDKYEAMLLKWLHSQGNCASSFICGPANFPAARMQKRMGWADNHFDNWREWREKVYNAYRRQEKKNRIEQAGGELEMAKRKLAGLERLQEHMKKVNAAHKAYLKNPESLEKSDLSEADKEKIKTYVPRYSWEKHPFKPYELTNNNATIRATRQRIAELEAKERLAENQKAKEHSFEGGRVVLNYEEDRVQILYDEKPSPEKIRELKSRGFKWSPRFGAWQRQLTENALYATRWVTGVQI